MADPIADEELGPRERVGGWAQTIRAVNAPLGFYVLCLFIVEAVLTIVLVQAGFDSSEKFSGLLLSAMLFILVVFLTTHLVIFHPESLVFGPKDHLRRREIERQTAAERLQRAQLDAGEDGAGGQPEEQAFALEFGSSLDGAASVVTEYLELETRAFTGLSRVLLPGWKVVPSIKLVTGVLVDAIVTGPDQSVAAVVEVKAFRFKRAMGERIRSAIFHVQNLAQAFGSGSRRPIQLLVWAAGSDGAKPTPAQLRSLRPIFQSSSTYFALYTSTDDRFGFVFDVPPFATPDAVRRDLNVK